MSPAGSMAACKRQMRVALEEGLFRRSWASHLCRATWHVAETVCTVSCKTRRWAILLSRSDAAPKLVNEGGGALHLELLGRGVDDE